MRALITGLVLSLAAGHAGAEEARRIESRDVFVGLIADRQLARFGIRLSVTPAGEIAGRAFGKPVTGAWRWSDGYFCRDLRFGDRELGPNCQVVEKRGQTLRFIADKGAGDHADLRLD
ncbi:MAG: dihydrodipicolinate reductase [Paracoccaceae bacterium]|jgi:hypothetical protein